MTPPNVDIATKIGMRKAKYPNILSAKVTATASLPNREKKEKVILMHLLHFQNFGPMRVFEVILLKYG